MEVRRRRIAKNKRKVVFRLLLIIFILLLISAGVVGGILLLRRTSSNTVHPTKLNFSSSHQYVFNGTGFLYYQGNAVGYDDISNDKADDPNHYATDGGPATLVGNSSLHLLYNSAGMKISDVDYPISASDFGRTILSVKCGTASVAALCADAQNAESILVYGSDGVEKDHLVYDGFIVDYGFYSATNEYLYVISLALDSGTPQSTITIYDSEMNLTSMIQIPSQMIEQMRFTGSGIYVVGTNQIIRYSLASSREAYRETVYGWEALDFDATNAPAFLLAPRNAAELDVAKLLIMRDGDAYDVSQRLLQLPAGTINAFLMGGKLVAVTQQGYFTYDMEGKLTGEKKFAESIHSAVKINGNILLLQKGEACYFIKIS